MARWGRASRLLARGPSPLAPGSRVLDVGCAFGYGTSVLARCYQVEGLDVSESHVRRARRRLPSVRFTLGRADNLPYPDGTFDAVVILDVVEHVAAPSAALSEAARILQPGGVLILSTPNRGLLSFLDSLNVYAKLFGSSSPAPTDDPSWPEARVHRHYSLDGLRALLAPDFQVEAYRYTGIGVAELVNLMLLIVVRRWLRAQRIYSVLQWLYFVLYVVEDEMSLGRFSYHVMVAARKV